MAADCPGDLRNQGDQYPLYQLSGINQPFFLSRGRISRSCVPFLCRSYDWKSRFSMMWNVSLLRTPKVVIIITTTSPASRLFILNFCLGADQRKHQSSASLAFVRWIHRSPVNFPAQRASNAENVFIWWRHHVNSGRHHDNRVFSVTVSLWLATNHMISPVPVK